jgi:hypothetical protein
MTRLRREVLQRLYVKEKLSRIQIAIRLRVSVGAVEKALKRHGIRRSPIAVPRAMNAVTFFGRSDEQILLAYHHECAECGREENLAVVKWKGEMVPLCPSCQMEAAYS